MVGNEKILWKRFGVEAAEDDEWHLSLLHAR